MTTKILITGGTGSLGTALIDHFGPRPIGYDPYDREVHDYEFTVLARNETRMAEFKKQHPHVRCEIGDVRDLDWLNTILPGHDICIHAAAIKQVPTAEANVRETVLTNVMGSQNIVMACVEAGVKRVVGISTDKACQPTTLYGGTKYLMEGLFREADRISDVTRFILVRYGNVLRSNASVVPLFEKQIAEDKPFTVTSKKMSRFWLSMKDALNLILYATKSEKSGIIIVPKAPGMYMVDLATALDPGREIIEIGIRAGEKIHEQLINSSEALHTFDNGKYFEIHPPDNKTISNLPFGFEYTSDHPDRFLTSSELYRMLDSYNPYGGRKWRKK